MSDAPETSPDGMLILDEPIRLPNVLDLLAVGGGPAGTAAAFRAKELGLAALVIDFDDLMKRIRDYAKDKPILPSFGGGDQMKFPPGGELVSQLAFDPVDKDEMCRKWKALYRRFNVPAKLGIELLNLSRTSDGIWQAKTWNHNNGREEVHTARHVVLAIGRGVPRRLDIPGNVEGIARRLADPDLYASGPVCVVGGGTSAAEAVIAISNAKKQAGDSAPVYWSYRGDQMPKVSKALADVFFDAYVGNGNIRYQPHSEPTAVATDPENRDFLCIRTDRKVLANRPVETVHLEFPKSACIACIGEDLPEPLLNSIGIFRASGGPRNRKRFVVSPLMETSLPHLYLAGDLLSPAYLETDDFEADPATFREVKRRGNVKAALRDGVVAAEVIARRIAGETRIHVQLGVGDRPISSQPEIQPSSARLVRILEGETTADEFPLQADGPTTIGSRGCHVCFAEDTELAPKHASILRRDEAFWLSDESGGVGVFLQPCEGRPVEVEPGAVLKAGEQWLVFAGESDRPELIHYDATGREVRRLPLSERPLVLGREAADAVLDRSDLALSRRHLSVALKKGRLTFTDLSSTNGTLLKVQKPTSIRHGDKLLLGHQLLQFVEIEENAPRNEVQFEARVPASKPEPKTARPAVEALTVAFGQSGKPIALRPGQTICDLAEEHGVPITAQCHQGICGSDPIRIVSGQEHLNPLGEGEEETLEDLCSLEAGVHRLACLARPTGPVVVKIVGES